MRNQPKKSMLMLRFVSQKHCVFFIGHYIGHSLLVIARATDFQLTKNCNFVTYK